ncbi:MAG: outer membrane lipoprotein-sorting protein [Candidatus Aureabacteria bacterium]|nr:outer membrane lipoprotein-sorting protein [Candidatus Auribacterota bacterium]
MKKNVLLIAVFSFFFYSGSVFSEPTVQEIVNKANNVSFYQGKDGKASISMTISDNQGRTRKRVFKILRFDIADGGNQKFFVYFSAPADVENMVYMVWKNVDGNDDRWMYLPALDLVRRIAATDKRSSFVGSDFVYEDISGRSLELDTHELVSSEQDTYKIRNTPKNSNEVEFAYFDVYIRKDNFMPYKAEYFNKKNKLYRTIEALEIKDINGFPTVLKSKATDIEKGSNTIIEFSEVEYDLGFEENIFTERFLRRPPRKWLK